MTDLADVFKPLSETLDELPAFTAALQAIVEDVRERALVMERNLANERLEMERIRSELLRALDLVKERQDNAGDDLRREAERLSSELSEVEKEIQRSEATSADVLRRISEVEVLAERAAGEAVTEATQAMRDELQRVSDDVVRNLKGLDSRFLEIDGRIKDVDGRIAKVFVSPPPSSIQVKKDGVKVGERRAINFTGDVTVTDDRDGVQVAVTGGGGGGGDADTLEGEDGSHYLARANHTGTQTAATISDFSTAADARIVAVVVKAFVDALGVDAATLDGETVASLTTSITAAIVDSAPGTLNTLNELAAALGDDADFATTVTNALAGKQPLDADLTALAALTTTAFGRSVLEAANAAALRTLAAAPADADVVHDTGDETIAGVKTFSSAPVVPDNSWSIADTSGLQAALDAKAPTANPTFTGTVTIPDGALAIADTNGLQAALDAKEPLGGSFASFVKFGG